MSVRRRTGGIPLSDYLIILLLIPVYLLMLVWLLADDLMDPVKRWFRPPVPRIFS